MYRLILIILLISIIQALIEPYILYAAYIIKENQVDGGQIGNFGAEIKYFFLYSFFKFVIPAIPLSIIFLFLSKIIFSNIKTAYIIISVVYFLVNVIVSWIFLYLILDGNFPLKDIINIIVCSLIFSCIILIFRPFSRFIFK